MNATPEAPRATRSTSPDTDRTLYELFLRIAAEAPEEAAYRTKRDGAWVDLSWREARDAVERVARGLLAAGVRHGDRVCILGDSRLEWVLADIAIGAVGGVTVGIYPSSLADDCAYIIEHCEAEILFVENDDQASKARSIRDRLPRVRHLVAMTADGPTGDDIVSWNDFLAGGDAVAPDAVAAAAAATGPDDVASFVYTSGTTGLPKGAMLSHRNLLFSSWSASESLDLRAGWSTLLFLPLAHVFARIVIYFCMRNRVAIAFAEGIQHVGPNLLEVAPQFIAGVPRIFEKVHEKVLARVEAAGGLRVRLFHWAVGVGRRIAERAERGEPVGALDRARHAIAHRLVLGKVLAGLGGRLHYAVSGSAPLNPEVARFFAACGLTVLEGYGMTENSSFSHVNRLDVNRIGTVGPPGPGIEVRLADDGEILFRGDNVMQGYYKQPDATAEAIDADGWLHSGDIGEVDADGYLRITDRKKDLIITAGGKNIAPARVEAALKGSKFISQAMAYGDRKKYLVAVVTLDPDTVRNWNAGCADALADGTVTAELTALVDGEVERANAELASFETVKKVVILPDEFTVESGELTASLKLKRKVVTDRHREAIEALYTGGNDR